MRKFIATIEIPVAILVEAEDLDEAEAIANDLFAEVYSEFEAELHWPNVWFYNRYDDTDIMEVKE